MFYLKLLFVFFIIINSLSIQANTALEQVGQLSLSEKTYKVDGQYLYATSCGSFEVFDLVDPLKPNLLANLPITTPNWDCANLKVSIGNSFAYVVSFQAIDIIDISMPTKPKRVGNYELPQGNTIYDFMVIGKYGYVVFTNSILVLDLTNPSKPALVGSKTFPSDTMLSIKVKIKDEQLVVRRIKKTLLNTPSLGVGNYLTTDELLIFSLKNPVQIEQVGNFTIKEENTTEGLNSNFYVARTFEINGQYLYVESLGDILTIDISDPTKPQQVGIYAFFDASSWYVNNLVVNGNILYFLRNNTNQENSAQDFTHKVFALDISSPAKLTLASTYKVDRDNYTEFRTIYLYKQYLRLNNLVLDISQPSQIKVVDTPKPTSYYAPFSLILNGIYIYTLSYEGFFSVIDVSNPTLPQQLDTIALEKDKIDSYFPLTTPYSMAVNNNYIYACHASGLYIIDISNHSQPKKIGTYPLPKERCSQITIFSNYAYVIASTDTSSENKIISLDVSNPNEPIKVGEYQSTNRRWNKLVARGEQLYALSQTTREFSAHLHILNTSNPTMLQELANYDTPFFSSDMALIEQYIYLTNGMSLHIVDVSDSSSPKRIGTYSSNSWKNSSRFLNIVSTKNNFLYLGNDEGLFKLDVSNPIKPKQVSQVIPPVFLKFFTDLAVDEPYVYRLNGVNLQVFKSVEVEAPQMTQIKGLANGACELNLSAKMLGADDGTGKNAGDFYLQWKETGRESTTSGDAVIAGYFYAPSEKVTWGSEANPEVYAKLWFAANGMLNANFFHVGVFDVQLATSYGADMPQLNGGYDLDHNKITIGRKAWRYSRHDYTNWRSCGKTDSALGSLKVEEVPRQTLKDMAASNPKFTTSVFKSPSSSAAKININQQGSCELLMDAKMLNATSNGKPYGNLKLQWKEILRSTTSGGDTVVAGYFYGSPNEVSWGSTTNPEAYVKIWYARNGMLNVNFFHVGVFDIELTSSYKGSVPDGIDGYLTDDNNFINIWSDANRYSRHDYNNWKLCN